MGIISGVALIVTAILVGIANLGWATISTHFLGAVWLIAAGLIAFDLVTGGVILRRRVE